MKRKKFEYYHRDVKQLKKDIAFRFVFSALFIITFVWQIASLIFVSITDKVSVLQLSISAIVMLCSISLTLVTMSFAFKDLRIIAAIKLKGKCVSSVSVLFETGKGSFIKLYSLLMQFLTLVTTLVLIASVTYSILQVAYLSTLSFYLPMLLMVCTAGYNSIYHIRDEILTQQNVQEQQPLY